MPVPAKVASMLDGPRGLSNVKGRSTTGRGKRLPRTFQPVS